MTSSTLIYYHRLNTGGIIKGPVEYTYSAEKQREASIETFEYAHKENKSTMTESMTNSVGVEAVFKAIDLNFGHENSFTRVTEKSVKTGREIKEFEKEFVKTSETRKYILGEDEFVASYVPIQLICFTVNGGKRQYANIPISESITVPADEEEIKKMMANSAGFLLEKKSWRAVTDLFHNVELHDIDALAKTLEPVNFPIHPKGTVTVHLQSKGDRDHKFDAWAGTKGEDRRLEGFQIKDISGGLKLEYMAHIQSLGDTAWTSGFVGTKDQSKHLEGFAIRIKGPNPAGFSVRYRAHIQTQGDTGWYENGNFCGTKGQKRRIEAMYVSIIRPR